MTHNSRTGTNYWTRVKEGNCGMCGRPRGPGGTDRLCAQDAERQRKKMAGRRAGFRRQGKCTECGAKLRAAEQRLCRLHKLEVAVRNEQYRRRHNGPA